MNALLLIALLAAPASAKIMMSEPPVAAACSHVATMPALATCLKPRGLAMTELATLAGARLFEISTADKSAALQSVALYVQDKTGWHLGGLHELEGLRGQIAVTRFETIGTAEHHGYRFDISLLQPSAYSPDDVTTEPALDRRVEVNLCPGDRYSCMRITASCAEYVAGQVLDAWSGSVEVVGENVTVSGTATSSRSACGGGPAAYTLQQLGFRS